MCCHKLVPSLLLALLKAEVGGFGGPEIRGERMAARWCGQVLGVRAQAGAGGEQWARRVR